MTHRKILLPALPRTKTSSVLATGTSLVPLIENEDGVTDAGARLAHLNYEVPTVRLALSSAANLAKKFHDGSLLSERLYR
jgi:hypothetical protein